MSFLFRPHKGGYAESMALVEEFDSIDDFIEKVKKDLEPFGFDSPINTDTVTFQPFGIIDSRNGWSCTYVILKDYGVLGHVNLSTPQKEHSVAVAKEQESDAVIMFKDSYSIHRVVDGKLVDEGGNFTPELKLHDFGERGMR